MLSEPVFPTRRAQVDTLNPDDIEKLYSDRHRSVIQLQPGELRFQFRELSWGTAAIQNERWSCGVRILAERPASYVAYALVTRGTARWMGTPIQPGSVLRITGPWECTSDDSFAFVAFGVPRATLDWAASRVHDPDQSLLLPGNQVFLCHEAPLIATRLLGELNVLEEPILHPAAAAAASWNLLQLALRLERTSAPTPVEHLSSRSGRRAAVRRVESYLVADPATMPSIPELCEIAGVSERTLEYAFREKFGTTPVRYLKLRRLTMARRKLLDPDCQEASVTDIATRCGFYELGRFAADYRQHFGELPSETLARRSSRRRGFSAQRPIRSAVPAVTAHATGTPRQNDPIERPSYQPTS